MKKVTPITEFVNYCKQHITGDEKGEAQIFLDHFFMALGWKSGLKEAGAEGERRILKIREEKKSTSFADLVWADRVLIEMKKRGEDLSKHLEQAKSYWIDLVPKPQYVVLCNFDEFWIYDFNKKVYEPLDCINLTELEKREAAFNFLKPTKTAPVFGNNFSDVTKDAAKHVAWTYRNMVKRKVEQSAALNFCLQCVLAMFAEDAGLLPENLFTKIIDECEESPEKSYDLISGLFVQMNTEGITPGGRYKGVDYFNGGLFETVNHIELTHSEILSLKQAAHQDWSKVNPAIFGSIFESGMDETQRHEFGAHYTSEADIKMIVYPCIVNPWLRKIDAAENTDDYYKLLRELRQYKVLDAACGSGNFLFVAYRELKLIERKLLHLLRLNEKDGRRFSKFWSTEPFVSIKQFYGIDKNPYAVELAKVTLMVAKELLIGKEDADNENPLPLDNLNENIICADALFSPWPQVDVIIGNPPFQSKNKMQKEFGVQYVNKLRDAYPEVPGRADFCVYWFYKANQILKREQYAGLVGTNTITQNYSREGGLDKIVKTGEIIEAVQSMPWQGEAAVHVSIANWVKGKHNNGKTIYTYQADALQAHKVSFINSALSLKPDVSSAKVLECNKKPKKVFQGQTHGHEGFLLSKAEGLAMLKKHPEYVEVLKPFLIGDELVANEGSQPERFVIDFTGRDLAEAAQYKELFKILEKIVLPDRKARAEEQTAENEAALANNPKAKVNKHHINFYNNWWKLSYGREELKNHLAKLDRVIMCSRYTERSIFEFFSAKQINPNDKVMVFCFDDDYSFGIIQSGIHWSWLLEKCTTLGETPNYNSGSIWDTFPWPQKPTVKQVQKVANAARKLLELRNQYLQKGLLGNQKKHTLRSLYASLELPGKHLIKDAHAALDAAVLEAYGFTATTEDEILNQLLELNMQMAAKEAQKEFVQMPGLPKCIKDKSPFVSDDCVKFVK